MSKKPTVTKPDSVSQVETTAVDPVVERLDKIIELIATIKSKVNSIDAKVNSIQEKVPAPFDVSRLVKD